MFISKKNFEKKIAEAVAAEQVKFNEKLDRIDENRWREERERYIRDDIGDLFKRVIALEKFTGLVPEKNVCPCMKNEVPVPEAKIGF